MQRSPDGRHAAVRPRRSRATAATTTTTTTTMRKNSTAARLGWITVLVVFAVLAGAVLGAGLPIGPGRKQAVLSASDAAKAPPAGSSVLSQSAHRQGTSPGLALEPRPRTPAPVPSPTRAPAPRPRPTRAPTPAPTPTRKPALAPVATAENQTPTGDNELAWSEAILTALGDPLTDANIKSMGYWMQNEAGSPPSGIVGANNPINVSAPGYGGTPIKSEGGGYSLYSYPTVQDGIDATVAYLTPTGYGGILAALKAGAGLSSSSLAGEFSTYSGGGYSTVPDTWGASQGMPET
jgi:hypothetical protein